MTATSAMATKAELSDELTRRSSRIRFPTAKFASTTDVKKGSVKQELKVEGSPRGPIKDEQLDLRFSPYSSRRRQKRELSTKLEEPLDNLKLLDKPRHLKVGSKYAPPEVYAHLNYLTDYLAQDLDVVFCGINPGCRSAEVGCHFAHPTNHFWRCIHQAGFTDRQLHPSEDVTLPEIYNIGMTDLVERPSSEQAELSKRDMLNGVPTLLSKIVKYRPRVVCFVGMGIGELFCKEAIALSSNGTSAGDLKKGKFQCGFQNLKVVHPPSENSTVDETLFFVMPSSSARVTGYQLADKVKIVSKLHQHVQDLRANVKLKDIDASTMNRVSWQTSAAETTFVAKAGLITEVVLKAEQ